MSKKSEQVARLLKSIQPPQGYPELPESGTLLERGLVMLLQRHMPAQRAQASVDSLRKEFPDWNEARVSQAQEVAAKLAPRGGAKAPDKLRKLLPVAREVKEYLQEVFQKTHGLSLEFLTEDPAGGAKVLAQMDFVGNFLGSALLFVAEPGEQPIAGGHIRVLDRLKLITRTTSIKKAREAVAPLVPKGEALRFSMAIGYVADRWCDSRKPTCWECQLSEDCPTGKKVAKDWRAQQEKLAAQRVREEARREAQEARDRARAEREAERERKRAEAERERRGRALARERARSVAARKKAKAGEKPASGAKKSKAAPAAKKARAATASKTSKAAKAPKRAKTAGKPAAKKSAGARPARAAAAKKTTRAKTSGSKSSGGSQTAATRRKSTRRKVARR